jgi:hypothetical protein
MSRRLFHTLRSAVTFRRKERQETEALGLEAPLSLELTLAPCRAASAFPRPGIAPGVAGLPAGGAVIYDGSKVLLTA